MYIGLVQTNQTFLYLEVKLYCNLLLNSVSDLLKFEVIEGSYVGILAV